MRRSTDDAGKVTEATAKASDVRWSGIGVRRHAQTEYNTGAWR